MMRMLTSEQVSTYWDDIKAHLIYALPPHLGNSEDSLSRILEGLLVGTCQAWVLIHEKEVYGMATTTYAIEAATMTKNLMIFSLSAYQVVSDELWEIAFNEIKGFAQKQECEKLIAYTSVPRILQLAGKLGADIGTTLLVWEI